MCYQLQQQRPRYIPEHLRFDPDFINIVREELNNPKFDIVFSPSSPRDGLGVPSDRAHHSYYPSRTGCWTLVSWYATHDQVDIPETEHSPAASVTFTADVP